MAVGLFAGGQVGAGWNGVGPNAYQGSEQGVSGYLVAQGLVRDWPGQFLAQASGVAAIVGAALIASGVLMVLARGTVRAWHGEGLPRRVAHPARSRRQARRTGRGLRWPRVRFVAPAWLSRRAPAPTHESAPTEPDDAPSSEPAAHGPEPEAESLESAVLEADAPPAQERIAAVEPELSDAESAPAIETGILVEDEP
jgi:hypothetical protein